MCTASKNEWFQTWFDSPYYHALYQHRDHTEAANFLSSLLSYLKLAKNSSLLDLACGKGRHSVFLNAEGYDVIGVDLSIESIRHASQFENKSLRFLVQDMRLLKIDTRFDCILNLFTSFGYFDHEEDNMKVLNQVKRHLKPGGMFVLDYFNASLVSKNNLDDIEKSASGFHFKMKKRIEGGRIFKDICVTEGENKFHFTEQVQLLNATMLHAMLKESGLMPIASFGNYQLQSYLPDSSERLIIISRNE